MKIIQNWKLQAVEGIIGNHVNSDSHQKSLTHEDITADFIADL